MSGNDDPDAVAEIPQDVMAAAIRALHSDDWDTPELVIARAIMSAKAEQREADAEILRVVAGRMTGCSKTTTLRAIAAAIRAGA